MGTVAVMTHTMPATRGGPGRVAKLVRYSTVSGISTATSLSTLAILVGLFGVDAVVANVVATAVGTVPSFELNRRWVWLDRTRRSVSRQVAPFCALSFAGLVLSTLAVRAASARTIDFSRGWHTLAVAAANATAYGALWVVQFVLLDRVLFRHGSGRPAASHPRPPSDDAPDRREPALTA